MHIARKNHNHLQHSHAVLLPRLLRIKKRMSPNQMREGASGSPLPVPYSGSSNSIERYIRSSSGGDETQSSVSLSSGVSFAVRNHRRPLMLHLLCIYAYLQNSWGVSCHFFGFLLTPSSLFIFNGSDQVVWSRALIYQERIYRIALKIRTDIDQQNREAVPGRTSTNYTLRKIIL